MHEIVDVQLAAKSGIVTRGRIAAPSDSTLRSSCNASPRPCRREPDGSTIGRSRARAGRAPARGPHLPCDRLQAHRLHLGTQRPRRRVGEAAHQYSAASLGLGIDARAAGAAQDAGDPLQGCGGRDHRQLRAMGRRRIGRGGRRRRWPEKRRRAIRWPKRRVMAKPAARHSPATGPARRTAWPQAEPASARAGQRAAAGPAASPLPRNGPVAAGANARVSAAGRGDGTASSAVAGAAEEGGNPQRSAARSWELAEFGRGGGGRRRRLDRRQRPGPRPCGRLRYARQCCRWCDRDRGGFFGRCCRLGDGGRRCRRRAAASPRQSPVRAAEARRRWDWAVQRRTWVAARAPRVRQLPPPKARRGLGATAGMVGGAAGAAVGAAGADPADLVADPAGGSDGAGAAGAGSVGGAAGAAVGAAGADPADLVADPAGGSDGAGAAAAGSVGGFAADGAGRVEAIVATCCGAGATGRPEIPAGPRAGHHRQHRRDERRQQRPARVLPDRPRVGRLALGGRRERLAKRPGNASAEAKRSAGRLAIAVSTTASSAAEMLPSSSEGGVGPRSTRCA